MNGRLDKVAMTNKLMQLKRELHYKCEIGEKGEESWGQPQDQPQLVNLQYNINIQR